MRLIHYSNAPLTSVYSVEQAGERYEWHDGRKPNGLWVSVEGEDDWRAWCEAESFRDCAAQHAAEIVLAPDHRVLIVDTPVAMELFHSEFAVERDKYGKWKEWRIDWPRVAERHSGIVIAPYQWQHRLDGKLSGWYYSWDCASGCIWDASAVASLVPIHASTAAA